MSPVRLGFVGVGSMGQAAHLSNYATLPDCQVAALAELRPELANQVARRYGVPRVYASHRELIERERNHLDALVCIQQFGHHGAILPELLAMGLPILVEKPLAGSVQAGEKIIASARERGRGKLYIGYHKRSDPATMRVKQQIAEWQASGKLGKLKYVRISMPPGDWIANGFLHNVSTDEPYPQIAGDAAPDDMDANDFKRYTAFVNFYIHQVNLLRHLLGENYHVTYADPSGVLLVAQSEKGVCGVIEMAPYSTTIDWQEQALVAFEKGWIKLELPAPLASNRPGRVTIFSDQGSGAEPTMVIPTLPWIHAMRQQALNYVATVKGEKSSLCEADEALRDLQIARDYMQMFNRGK